MEKTRITALCCNSVMTSWGLLAEHGQSFLIETPDTRILFDVGQSDVFIRNAAILKKDLSETTHVVLSHGHYDHAGGLAPLMAIHSNFKLILHPDAFAQKLALFPDGEMRPIGMPHGMRDRIAAAGIEIVETAEPMEIAPGIWTTGEVPQANDFEKIEPVLMVKTSEGPRPDPLKDDLSLIVKTGSGAALLLGCAHRGTVNHVECAAEVAGVSAFTAAIGGMHLERATAAQIEKTVAALKRFNVKHIVPSHCAGPRATAALMSAFPENAFPNFVGYALNI
jgi:7,8-dihydropterin-6-yl-methyl-4-(beta-D-ribofuranosyl)aminobenzene 5'-phosphate synthase